MKLSFITLIALSFSAQAFAHTYFEACGMTRFQPLGAEPGGPGGHAVMYLHGVCKDYSRAYPRLKICEPGKDNHTGVGVSTAKYFKNVRWVAVPSRSFFFNGDMAEGTQVNEEAMNAVARRAIDLKIYESVDFTDEGLPADWKGRSRDEQVAYESIGTDIALRFVRNSYCAQVPVTSPMMRAIVSELNAMNDSFYLEGKRYDWDVFDNNCAHTVYNALAAAKITAPKRTEAPLLKKALHLALPSHVFIDLMHAANDQELPSFDDLYKDPKKRSTLLREGWLLTQHGVLAIQEPVFENNELFENADNFVKIQVPLINLRDRRFDRYVSAPKYFDAGANKRHFHRSYVEARARLDDLESYLRKYPNNQQGVSELYRAYQNYLNQRIQEVR
jgi:hypothetical protein